MKKVLLFKSVVYQMKSQNAAEVLRKEIVQEVRRLGYIFVDCKGFSSGTREFLAAEAIGIIEIRPEVFLVHDNSEQVVFYLQGKSSASPKEIKDQHKKAFETQVADGQTEISVEVLVI